MSTPPETMSLPGCDDGAPNAARKKDRTNRQIVLDTITDLCEHGNLASRQRVSEVSGLKMTIVDDHVSRLKADGQIRAIYNGVFEPIDQTINRPITVTALNNNRYKVEIGEDLILSLTPWERKELGTLLVGTLFSFNGLLGR